MFYRLVKPSPNKGDLMKRIPFIIIALALAWYMGGCGSENTQDVGGPSGNEVNTENELTFIRNFTFSTNRSTCAPGDIHSRVLSAYLNQDMTQFRLNNADDSVFLEGDLDQTLIHTYSETIVDEPADCFIRLYKGDSIYPSSLHEECQSEHYYCIIKWE